MALGLHQQDPNACSWIMQLSGIVHNTLINPVDTVYCRGLQEHIFLGDHNKEYSMAPNSSGLAHNQSRSFDGDEMVADFAPCGFLMVMIPFTT
mmetsp:Transcript_19314/g.33300  ORF Transcript_19314/g.33300 Transcript_19314/m.33300 type:complete len:93 (-) Transcript_19314:472-750(-)